jgi:hypothetical protein
MLKRILTPYFNSWWLPTLVYICLLGGFTITAIPRWKPLAFMANVLFCIAGLAFLGLIAASIWNLVKKRWGKGIINVLLVFGCGAATVYVFGFLMLRLCSVPVKTDLPTT